MRPPTESACSTHPKSIARALFLVHLAVKCGANGNWGTNSGHATMYGLVHVMRPQDYETFPIGERFASWCDSECTPEEIGETLFATKTCASCHGREPDAGAVAAPNLFGIAGTEQVLTDGRTVIADENYLRRSVLEPRADVVRGYSPIMPTIRVSEEELDALVAYIQSLH